MNTGAIMFSGSFATAAASQIFQRGYVEISSRRSSWPVAMRCNYRTRTTKRRHAIAHFLFRVYSGADNDSAEARNSGVLL
jgi:hypothetical protein